MNRVIISGRFTKDPDCRETTDGLKIARYTLAVDSSNRKDTYFFNFVAFDNRAEFVSKYCHKGMKILVEGELTTNSYTNKDGVKINTTDIRAISHEFCESKSESPKESPKESKKDDWMSIPDGVEDEGLPWT